MGIDLTLCPYRFYHESRPLGNEWFLASDTLNLDRDYDIQAAVNACNPKPLPEGWRFDWFGDEGIESRTTNPYGTPITYVTAEQLAGVKVKSFPWNKAVFAMMKALPPGTPVVLWWH